MPPESTSTGPPLPHLLHKVPPVLPGLHGGLLERHGDAADAHRDPVHHLHELRTRDDVPGPAPGPREGLAEAHEHHGLLPHPVDVYDGLVPLVAPHELRVDLVRDHYYVL